jgi:nucleoside-diphosphate-sugar epimerase
MAQCLSKFVTAAFPSSVEEPESGRASISTRRRGRRSLQWSVGRQEFTTIVDDEPARVCEWLPQLAQILGAKPPLRLPAWVGRLAIGEHGVMMIDSRGASNAKAKRELGWQPRWPTWRDGFKSGLSEEGSAARALTPPVVAT